MQREVLRVKVVAYPGAQRPEPQKRARAVTVNDSAAQPVPGHDAGCSGQGHGAAKDDGDAFDGVSRETR